MAVALYGKHLSYCLTWCPKRATFLLCVLFTFLVLVYTWTWAPSYVVSSVPVVGTVHYSFKDNASLKTEVTGGMDLDTKQFLLRTVSLKDSKSVDFQYASFDGRTIKVAIGGALTSRGFNVQVSETNVRSLAPFFELFPTFCKTASDGYQYLFYFGIDADDPLGTDTIQDALQVAFHKFLDVKCGQDLHKRTSLHLVRCDHNAKPAWAQNDAMMQAYVDGVDFFYRVNDDTKLITANWTEILVANLVSRDPPLVGVVGPQHNRGPQDIITHDFVHRTHIDIFGFYYPRRYETWYADTWINYVYWDRCVQAAEVKVNHTELLGRRYSPGVKHTAADIIALTGAQRDYINSYVQFVSTNHSLSVPDQGARVVVTSLSNTSDPRQTYGVIRSAQLLHLYLPDWSLRVYHTHLPDNLRASLSALGAQLHPVLNETLSPRMWPYDVINDLDIQQFLVRAPDWRLSGREAVLIRDWLNRTQKPGLYCIRDHPSHGQVAVTEGLWGGHAKTLRYLLKKSAVDFDLDSHCPDFLSYLWDLVGDYKFCHDSVSCHIWTHSHPFPAMLEEPHPGSFIGQTYDAFLNIDDVISEDITRNPWCWGSGSRALV